MHKLAMTMTIGLLLTTSVNANVVTDPVGDFIPEYSAGPSNPDLDVISSYVNLDNVANTLTFSGTHAGWIGQTPEALYVWGLDRGQGTERFLSGDPAIGAGVFFDSVVILRPNGTGSFVDFINGGATDFDPGSVAINGNTIASTALPLSLFPSTGFAPEDYTWNLWPRFGLGQNNQITDFAPDASNAAVNVVPEPATLALLGVGLLMARRRR